MKKLPVALLLVGILTSGCATTSLGVKSSQLNVGMSKDQVQAVLGAPRRTSVSGDGLESWYYWKVGMFTPLPDQEIFASSENRLGVTFKNDRVVSWGDQYDWQQWSREIVRTSQDTMKNMPPIKVQVEQTAQPAESKENTR